MRILLLSNAPWSNSGYGNQSRIFLSRLAELGHDMGIICFYGLEGGVLNMGKITCYPKRMHPYGNDVVVPHSMAFRADITISLMDTWVMNPEEYPPGMRWVPWYPVDHDPIPPIVRSKIALAWKRIAMSQFGVEKTHEAGRDCSYIPHGGETNVMKPLDKAECRKALGLPGDKWIVGTVAMNKGNPSRKCFAEMLHAFAAFHRKHPDTLYALQTDRGEGVNDMVNIPELARGLGLTEGVDYTLCNQYQNMVGYPPEYLAQFYNSLDVHMLTSKGEGFGIPTLEAQACAVPVIVGGWTASKELCFSGQCLDAERDAEREYTALASYQYRPLVKSIERALEREYNHASSKEKALAGALPYDADEVVKNHWIPVLKEIEAAL